MPDNTEGYLKDLATKTEPIRQALNKTSEPKSSPSKAPTYTGPTVVPVEDEENEKYMTKSLGDINRKLSKSAVRGLPRLPNRSSGR